MQLPWILTNYGRQSFSNGRNIPLAGRVFGKGMTLIDEYTPVNKLAIFDHMYSYYVKTK